NTLSPVEVSDRMQSVVAEEKNRFIFGHRLASGVIRQVEVHSSPLNIDGRSLLYSTIIDVTDKLRTEAALRESDERIRLVFRHTPTAIAIFDRSMRYLFATTAWISDHRLLSQSIIGRSCYEVQPNFDQHWREMFDCALAGETVHSEDEKFVRADGTIDWIRCVVSPWRNGRHDVGGIIVFTESVTQEKLARDALQESEARYRSLFENLIDGFAYHKILVDANGKPIDYVFLEVNDAFEQMTELKREDIIGRTATESIPGIERTSNDWIEICGRVALQGETARFETELKKLKRWFSVSAYSPKRGYFVTVMEDITARKNIESELREHQRATIALLGNLPGMAYRCRNDRDWSMEYVSEGCEELTGYTPREFLESGAIDYNDCIHPDDREFVWSEVQRALEKDERYRLIYRIVTRNGKTKWVWEQGSAVAGSDVDEVTIEGFIADITDRKDAEDALQSREEHFRALIDNSSDVITLVDAEGKILYLSPSVERILGYAPDDLQGTSVFKALARGDRLRAREVMRRALVRGGADISLELRARHKDGTMRILDVAGRNLLQDPHVGAIVVNSRDITDRRMVETERAQLATAVEQATESIVITDTRGRIIYVNSAFEKVSGYSRDEAVGQYASMLKSGEHSRQFYHDIWTILTAGEPWVGRFKNRHKNGALYEEECAISPIKDATGKVINFVAVKRDVTKEVELEDRLRQAQKLEAVGRLASGIAHDFNNLLAGIRGFGELISQEADDESKLRGYSEEIVRAASRAADLTSQLLAFARKGNYLTVPVDIHETIKEVANILKHTIDRRIEIRMDLAAGQAIVKGDPSQIQSAILNLGVNSRDAMPEGGQLVFATRNVSLDDEYCRRHSLDFGPGNYIAITVSDTGIGIDEAVLAHIFDPFFTTKEQGQGTGLGLAGVYGCVRNHHGSVEVNSEVGKGSAFTLYLPAQSAVSIGERPGQAEVSLEGRERVLVVDDEEIVRNLAEKMLTKAGYQVITCVDGAEAVQLYRTAIGSIDLVLLDMIMPRMNGRDTYVALKKFNPSVRVLMMSGFADTDVQQIINQGIAGFVHKPFQMRVFLAKVREALDSKPAGRSILDRY
ncbi:MAG: PAS domain S-box protein, partial [Candidatus Zixiibacteriota bacterium]